MMVTSLVARTRVLAHEEIRAACHGASRGANWIQTMPGKGYNAMLRLYSPLEPFFTKEWRPSEIELVH
jgi:hypothetical protein